MPQAAYQTALAALQQGRLDTAQALFSEFVARLPEQAAAWYYLAVIAQQQDRPETSLEHLSRALALQPGQPAFLIAQAQALHDLKRLSEAESAFLQAVQHAPQSAPAWSGLGLVLSDLGRRGEAIAAFRQAVTYDPAAYRAHFNLGVCLQAEGPAEAAVGHFEAALAHRPDYVPALQRLVALRDAVGQFDAVEALCRRLLTLQPGHVAARLRLGHLMLQQLRLDEAELLLREGLQLDAENIALRTLLAETLASAGQVDAAREQYRTLAAAPEGNLKAEQQAALILPFVYRSRDHLEQSRADYAQALRAVQQGVLRHDRLSRDEVADALCRSNFNLAYQGGDDRTLQQQYGQLLATLWQQHAPAYLCAPKPEARAGRRIRVGFLGSFFYTCTAGLYFQSWLEELDPQQFEVFCYYTDTARDALTASLQQHVAHFRFLSGGVFECADEVQADRLDLLIYPEVGMNGKTFALASLRLAQVQCAAWGHPVTTGLQTVDVFLGCADMEPSGAEPHYSERLHCLPGIGTRYPLHALPDAVERAAFGLPQGRTLYLCPQSLNKIHPDCDALFARVLAADPDGLLVLFQGPHRSMSEAFLARLVQAFRPLGLEVSERLHWLPRMGHDDYLRVNQCCDLMLDTLHWSGGNTSLDAIRCGLPMVTLPGAFMRGRQSMAMLRRLGLDDLIAGDVEEYVRIALELGRDPAWRARVRTAMQAGVTALCRDDAPICALNALLPTLLPVDAGNC